MKKSAQTAPAVVKAPELPPEVKTFVVDEMTVADQAVLAELDAPEAPIKRPAVVLMADDPNEVVKAVQAAMPKEAAPAETEIELKPASPPISDRTRAEMECGAKTIGQYK